MLLFCSTVCILQANAVDGLYCSWNRSVMNCMTVTLSYRTLNLVHNLVIFTYSLSLVRGKINCFRTRDAYEIMGFKVFVQNVGNHSCIAAVGAAVV